MSRIVRAMALSLTVLTAGTPGVRAQDLPEGEARPIVARACGTCHDINRIRAGYTPEGWRTVIRMMQNAGAPVAPAEWDSVTRYLTAHFPERPRPNAVLLPGPAKIRITLWPVPTPGSRPHDPLATRDGHIWWTGQLANTLGRLDPKTGVLREFTLQRTLTGPHGLAEDAAGNIWFTGNHAGLIGRLDPKTGAVTEYPMPDAAARDPHTLIFDRDGILWFTVQQGNRIGRLDPRTGEIKLATSPTAGSRPYGMALNSKNDIYLVEFGSNKVARIDKDTLALKEYSLPAADARPRRLWIGPDDKIWYTDFRRGMLGRLDPEAGAVKEWLSPSGARAEPYGIVFTKGAVWYSESGAKPNTIVRFDPSSETFQSWAIPGGGDIVRNMDVTRDGHVVTANSLTNEIGLVEILD